MNCGEHINPEIPFVSNECGWTKDTTSDNLRSHGKQYLFTRTLEDGLGCKNIAKEKLYACRSTKELQYNV
jgi:hypothetical protein